MGKTFIISHKHPDGDAIGSVCGMYRVLKHLKRFKGKIFEHLVENCFCSDSGESVSVDKVKDSLDDVILCIDDTVPERLSFIPGSDRIIPLSEAMKLHKDGEDLLIVVDCATMARCGLTKEIVDSFGESFAIDHHHCNERFCHFNLVDTNYVSTALLIHVTFWGYSECWRDYTDGRMFIPNEELDDNNLSTLSFLLKNDNDYIESVYVGTLTDSCRFSVMSNAYRAMYELASLAAATLNIENISTKLFGQISVKTAHWLSYLYLNFVQETLPNGIRVTKLLLPDRDVCEKYETGWSSDVLRGIENTDVAYFIENAKNGVSRISCRVNCDCVNANELMKSIFNGGGHPKAAGAMVEMPVDVADKLLMTALGKYNVTP